MTVAGASTAKRTASSYGEAFASVFDAHLAPEDTRHVLARLRSCMGPPPAKALELGVGTGRLALPLVRAGYEVTGVESSPAMAARLLAKPDGDQVRLIEGDYSELDLGGPYDLIYGVEIPLAQLHPREVIGTCLRKVARALRPGARFIVDAVVPPPHRRRERHIHNEASLPRGGRLISEFTHDPDDCVAWGTATVVAADGRAHRAPVICSYQWPTELDALASDAGLRVEQRFRDWSGAPYEDDACFFVTTYRREGGA